MIHTRSTLLLWRWLLCARARLFVCLRTCRVPIGRRAFRRRRRQAEKCAAHVRLARALLYVLKVLYATCNIYASYTLLCA